MKIRMLRVCTCRIRLYHKPNYSGKKQIYNKTVNRIDTIQNASTTRLTTNGSQNVPSVSDIQSIINYVFRVNADTPALRTAAQSQINQLKIKYPSYNFSAQFGGS